MHARKFATKIRNVKCLDRDLVNLVQISLQKKIIWKYNICNEHKYIVFLQLRSFFLNNGDKFSKIPKNSNIFF